MLIREIRGKGFAFAFVEVSRKKPSSLRARFKEAKEEGTVQGRRSKALGRTAVTRQKWIISNWKTIGLKSEFSPLSLPLP